MRIDKYRYDIQLRLFLSLARREMGEGEGDFEKKRRSPLQITLIAAFGY
jgi:hypothetical protein